jgi:hypothetical protein
MISKGNNNSQARTDGEFRIEPCTFCEFVRNNSAMEHLEEEDERMFLKHLLLSHGLER